MFQVKSSNQLEGEYDFILEYKWPGQVKLHQYEVKATTPKQAYLSYCNFALEYLFYTMDLFCIEVMNYKPHYFNYKAVPYMGMDRVWTRAFWLFVELRNKLLELRYQPVKYVQLIQGNIDLFEKLIPLSNLFKTKQIKLLYTDIDSVSKKIIKQLEKSNSPLLSQVAS